MFLSSMLFNRLKCIEFFLANSRPASIILYHGNCLCDLAETFTDCDPYKWSKSAKVLDKLFPILTFIKLAEKW